MEVKSVGCQSIVPVAIEARRTRLRDRAPARLGVLGNFRDEGQSCLQTTPPPLTSHLYTPYPILCVGRPESSYSGSFCVFERVQKSTWRCVSLKLTPSQILSWERHHANIPIASSYNANTLCIELDMSNGTRPNPLEARNSLPHL